MLLRQLPPATRDSRLAHASHHACDRGEARRGEALRARSCVSPEFAIVAVPWWRRPQLVVKMSAAGMESILLSSSIASRNCAAGTLAQYFAAPPLVIAAVKFSSMLAMMWSTHATFSSAWRQCYPAPGARNLLSRRSGSVAAAASLRAVFSFPEGNPFVFFLTFRSNRSDSELGTRSGDTATLCKYGCMCLVPADRGYGGGYIDGGLCM